ncbi:MAG: pyrimidine dimer DNA glycosylase/endonuclease V [Endomicrobia bacterium]|nr:pyrimidine dimer DNA glycosylase/endonuclease V [Endomicrobiia bacterium]MDW7973591.1 pyrimidine dimer DNA glycosylase/endonuclease V [Thermodesulfovibrio sp.]MDW8055927.1 pyrimidine dimer DNA glycosylase/endonuclease V [Elusimicrobiota bacterium]
MRIWDIEPKFLCRKHLLGEHRELHAIWNILTKNKKGYSKHPETLRWRGKLKSLYIRHEKLVKEMLKRGYKHNSELDKNLAKGKAKQNVLINSLEEQKQILKQKGCSCFSL